MTTPATELIVDFAPVASDAPADATFAFSVRNEATGDAWSGGSFRSPLDDVALADLRWYLEEYVQWPFGPWRDRAHAIEARLEQHGRALFAAIFDAREPARIYQRFLDAPAATRTLTLISTTPHVLRLCWCRRCSSPLRRRKPGRWVGSLRASSPGNAIRRWRRGCQGNCGGRWRS